MSRVPSFRDQPRGDLRFSASFFSGYEPRFCQIVGSDLIISSRDNRTRPMMKIPLSEKKLRLEHPKSPTTREFKLHVGEDCFYFEAATKEEFQQWLDVLKLFANKQVLYILPPTIRSTFTLENADEYGHWNPIEDVQMEEYQHQLFINGYNIREEDERLLRQQAKKRVTYSARPPAGPDAKIIEFVRKGNFAEVQKLLSAKKQLATVTDPKGESLLILATQVIAPPRPDLLALILSQGVDVNWQNGQGRTALHYATDLGQLEYVKALLENDADISLRDNSGYSAWYLANLKSDREPWRQICETIKTFALKYTEPVEKGDRATVQRMLSAGKSPDFKDQNGFSLLHKAVEKGQDEMLEFLLIKWRAFPNCQDFRNITPLHLACYKGNVIATNLLLANSADPFMKDNLLYLPIHVAVLFNHHEVVRELVTKNPNTGEFNTKHVDCVGHLRDQVTPLHIAAYYNCEEAGTVLLVEAFARFDIQDRKQKTALDIAKEKNSPLYAIMIKISKGMDLLSAVQKRNKKQVETMLNAGYDINFVDENGYTALHWACAHQDEEMIDLLLEKDANVLAKVGNFATPVQILKKLERHDLASRLEDFKKKAQLLSSASAGSLGFLKQFVEQEGGIATHMIDRENNTALHKVAEGGHDDCLRFLLTVEPFARNSINRQNSEGQTPIILASKNDKTPCALSLLNYGGPPSICLVNQQDHQGNTALHYAVERHYVRTVRVLLEHGADFKIPNKLFSTPLHIALSNKSDDSDADETRTVLRWHERGTELIERVRLGDVDAVRQILDEEDFRKIWDLCSLDTIQVSSERNFDLKEFLLGDVNRSIYSLFRLLQTKYLRDLLLDLDPCQNHFRLKEMLTSLSLNKLVRAFDIFEVVLGAGRLVLNKLGRKPRDMPDLVNFTNSKGETPLTAAVSSKDSHLCVTVLLERGADVHSSYKGETSAALDEEVNSAIKGETASRIAFRLGEEALGQRILKHELGMRLLYFCEEKARSHAETQLRRNNELLDVNFSNKYGETALYIVSRYGNAEFAKMLLDFHADPNYTTKYGSTPLHAAVEVKDMDTINLLLSRGAKIDIKEEIWHRAPAELAGNSEIKSKLQIAEIAYQMVVAVQKPDKEKLKNLIIKEPMALTFQGFPGKNTILHCAISHNNADIVTFLTSHELDISLVNDDGLTPMQLAEQIAQPEIIQLLKPYEKVRLIREIIYHDDVDALVKELTDPVVNPTFQDPHTGCSLVHWAACKGSMRCLAQLITAQFDLNLYDNSGFYPLHYASWFNKPDVIEFLLKNKAKPNVLSNDQQSPLSLALLRKNQECLSVFCVPGVDLNVRDREGRTPLIIATSSGDVDGVNKLLMQNVDVTLKDNRGFTALNLAMIKGHVDCLPPLLKVVSSLSNAAAREDIIKTIEIAATKHSFEGLEAILQQVPTASQSKNTKGETPLHFVVAGGGYKPCIDLLLEKGAKVNAVTNEGIAPLHIAVVESEIPIIETLLRAGAEAEPKPARSTKNVKTVSAFALAKDVEVLHLLYQYEIGRQLWEAAKAAEGNTVNKLIKKNTVEDPRKTKYVNPSFLHASGTAPIHYAAKGAAGIVASFLQIGFNPDLSTEDSDRNTDNIAGGLTVIDVAHKFSKRDIEQTLENYKRDLEIFHLVRNHNLAECKRRIELRPSLVKVKDEWGNTPLHVACLENHKELVTLMVDNDADCNALNQNRRTPLHEAIINQCGEAIQVLITQCETNLKYDIEDCDGQSIIDLVSDIERKASARNRNDPLTEKIKQFSAKIPAAKMRNREREKKQQAELNQQSEENRDKNQKDFIEEHLKPFKQRLEELEKTQQDVSTSLGELEEFFDSRLVSLASRTKALEK